MISTLQHDTSHQEVLLHDRALWLCTTFRKWFKFWTKVDWFQIEQEALQWQRVLSKKELHVPAPALDVPAIVAPWHLGGKAQYNKWITVATHNQSRKDQILKDVRKLIIIQAYFTGQASEPKEASKWWCGTIKEAFLDLFTCLRMLWGRQRWSHRILEFSHWEKFKFDWNFDLTHQSQWFNQ